MKWTPEAVTTLKDNAHLGAAALAEIFGVKPDAVYCKAKRLKIRLDGYDARRGKPRATSKPNGAAKAPSPQPEPTAPPPWQYREHALLIQPGILWDEWLGLWSSTERMQKSSAFWTGDALLAGQAAFGERFTQVVDSKYIFQQRGPMWVCSRIPPERRRADLSYSFHREIAALEPEAQDRWMAWAAPECTVAALKEAMDAEKRARAAYPSNGAPPPDPEPPLPSLTDSGSTWNEDDAATSTFGSVEDIEGGAQEPPQRTEDNGVSEVPPESVSPSPDATVDELRALIETVRRLAPRLSTDWRTESTIKDPGTGRFTVRFTKGDDQIAMGEGPSLPAALVETALAAMLSDMDRQG